MKDWQIKFVPQAKTVLKRREEIINFLLADREIKDVLEFFKPQHPSKLTPTQAGINQREIERAIKILWSVKEANQKVLVWGDYDVDGIAGTTILWEALWRSGFNVLPFIPDRAQGYGLNYKSFKQIYQENPDLGLIVTVDNGIVAHWEIDKITKMGVKIIVTDHHARAKSLPPKTSALIWSDQICGAAVAWFLAREVLGNKTYALDLLALATVTDMIPLLKINRSLVKYGLEDLVKTDRVGLRALMNQAGINTEDLSVYHLGFLLGPRLNAMGRLYHALDSVRLLCTLDKERAKSLAQKLDLANRERQLLTEQALKLAEKIVVEENLTKQKAIFVYHPSFHSGIIGLVAGKLTEKFCRPSVVLAEENGFFRGSCRSIRGFNIILALRQLNCLVDVGGHPLAAGFTIERKNLDRLKKEFLTLAEKEIDKKALIPVLTIDAQVSFTDLSRSFFLRLDQFKPFGLANPEPLFYTSGVIIREIRKVGRNGDHLKLVLEEGALSSLERISAKTKLNKQRTLLGIGFGLGGKSLMIGDRVDLVFSLTINRYQKKETLQLNIKDIRENAV